jgi:hypothetical protein
MVVNVPVVLSHALHAIFTMLIRIGIFGPRCDSIGQSGYGTFVWSLSHLLQHGHLLGLVFAIMMPVFQVYFSHGHTISATCGCTTTKQADSDNADAKYDCGSRRDFVHSAVGFQMIDEDDELGFQANL